MSDGPAVSSVGLEGREFVGRVEELAKVAASVDRALAGRAQVVWIQGDPGSGKTGLLSAVLERLPSAFRLVHAEADELAGEADLDLARQFGELNALDGFGAGLELLDLFDAGQDAGPLAVVVEDLHWADLASRQALLTVTRRLRDDRVIVLITTRPVTRQDGWERFVSDPDRCTRVPVGALTVSDVGELARRRGLPLDRPNVDRLHRHTRGHALYVQTLLAELSLEQLMSAEAELPAPHSLASTATALVADLPRDARALASAMAVVNQRRPLQLVGTIAGIENPELALEFLLATGFVSWWPSEVGTPVEYTHPLFRAAVYDDLSPTMRRHLHLAAAESLEPEGALVHRVAAASPGDEALVNMLIEAAGREISRGALGLAARDWLWVSSLSSRAERAEEGLFEAIRLFLADGQLNRALALRDRVVAARSQPLRSLVLGMLAWEAGDASSAERWLVDAEQLASDDPSLRQVSIAAYSHLAALYVVQGRGAEGVDAAGRALALVPDDVNMEVFAWSELVKAEARLRGAAASLEILAGRLESDPLQVPPAKTDLLVTRGTLGFYAGRTQAAIADLRGGIRLARLGAPATQLARAHLQLAQLLIIGGEWDDAVVHARLGISLVEDGQQVWLEAQAHAALASISASRGDWESAGAHVSHAGRAADGLGTAEAVFTARIAQSTVARARADAAGVIVALAPLVGTGASAEMTMITSLGWWPVLIHAHIQAGDIATADRQLRQLRIAAADRGLDLHARARGLEARVLQARGEPDPAEAAFDEAIAALRPDDPYLDRALLHHDFGRLLHARGKRQRAVEQLSLARDLLGVVRAEPYARRVDDDLASCGLQSSAAEHRSPLDLTDREQDVAALVAKGMTNREVAAELYVSTKAVEYHLRNIFGKLGIKSRNDLQAALSS
jgi:ATP/maltotriose-dependent transcriptional regulator MalT